MSPSSIPRTFLSCSRLREEAPVIAQDRAGGLTTVSARDSAIYVLMDVGYSVVGFPRCSTRQQVKPQSAGPQKSKPEAQVIACLVAPIRCSTYGRMHYQRRGMHRLGRRAPINPRHNCYLVAPVAAPVHGRTKDQRRGHHRLGSLHRAPNPRHNIAIS